MRLDNNSNNNNNIGAFATIADTNGNGAQSKLENSNCGGVTANGSESGGYGARSFVDSTSRYPVNDINAMNPTYYPACYENSLLNSPDMKSAAQNLTDNANCSNFDLFASSIIPQMNSYSSFFPCTSSFDWMEQQRLLMLKNFNRSNGKINNRQDNLCPSNSYTPDQQQVGANYGGTNVTAGLSGLTFPNLGASASNPSVLGNYFPEQACYGGYAAAANIPNAATAAYNFGDFCMINGFNDANNNNNATATMDMKRAAAAAAIFELTANGMPSLSGVNCSDVSSSSQTSNADVHSSSSNVQANQPSISKRVVASSSSPAIANGGSTMTTLVNPNDLTPNDVMSPITKMEPTAILPRQSKIMPNAESSFDFLNGSIPFPSSIPAASVNGAKMEPSAYLNSMSYILNSSDPTGSAALFNPNLTMTGMMPSSSSSKSDEQNARDFSLAAEAAAQFAAYSSHSSAAVGGGVSSYRTTGPATSTFFYTPPSGSGFSRANGSALRYFPNQRPNPPYKTGPGSNNVRVRTADKYRTVYSETQRCHLEAEYSTNNFVTSERKAELSTLLQLTERQIKIWFQNRRAKKKKEKGQH